jgi:hypothetical protein
VKITRKKGRNAKVYLSGEVFVIKNPKPSEDGESHVNVPNPALDF